MFKSREHGQLSTKLASILDLLEVNNLSVEELAKYGGDVVKGSMEEAQKLEDDAESIITNAEAEYKSKLAQITNTLNEKKGIAREKKLAADRLKRTAQKAQNAITVWGIPVNK